MYPPMTLPPSPLLDMSPLLGVSRGCGIVYEEDGARGAAQVGESGGWGMHGVRGSVLKNCSFGVRSQRLAK